MILAARFFSGIAGDVAFVATPMYIAEIADQNLRGRLSGTTYINMLVGLLIVYVVAPFVPIWASSLVGLGILVVQLTTFVFVPKSPYYLLMKGRKEEARRALQWFRGSVDVEEEMEEIQAAVARQQTERGDYVWSGCGLISGRVICGECTSGEAEWTGIKAVRRNWAGRCVSVGKSVTLNWNEKGGSKAFFW